MSLFSSKLDKLDGTVSLAAAADRRGLATSLRQCEAKTVVAIGSGGSLTTAEFFAACRSDLGHQATIVATPMAYVMDAIPAESDVWLFSASGNNPDIIGALEKAVRIPARSIEICTSGAGGELARLGGKLRTARVHFAPVVDEQDSFLATHSVVSATSRLILASDALAGVVTPEERAKRMMSDTTQLLSVETRRAMLSTLSPMQSRRTLFLLHDPRLNAAASVVETDLWEAGICAIQRTDFRNFAHGRHVWLSKHADETFVLALTCEESQPIWQAIREELPESIVSAHFDFGRAGRGAQFEAIIKMLTVIEAIGVLMGVDPGKPGVADFGRRIFEMRHLRTEASREDASVRRKRRSEAKIDPPGRTPTAWEQTRREFRDNLAAAKIGGLVLDYDGTVVATAHRRDPPDQNVSRAIIALLEHGLLVGFATGRGSSVGDKLREFIPAQHHANVVVGYYNGGLVAPLSVDIREIPRSPNADLSRFHNELCKLQLFANGWRPKLSAFQISLPLEKVLGGIDVVDAVEAMLPLGRLKLVRSAHSIDIVCGETEKVCVVDAIATRLDPSDAILRIGDSGEAHGNDYALLGSHLGLSVDKVCHRADCCWNPLPSQVAGPSGLLHVLRSLALESCGKASLDVLLLF